MRRLLLAAVVIGFISAPWPAHAATLAHLWISPSGGSCTRTPVPAAFVGAAACSSFNAAYQAASAGDLILIKGGSYGAQSITDRPTLGSTPVTIQVVAGESATINGDLSIRTHDIIIHGGDTLGVGEPDRLEIIGTVSPAMSAGQGNRNIVLEDINVHGSEVTLVFMTAWGTTLRHSNIGPLNPCVTLGEGDLIMGWWLGSTPIQNVTIEYNTIHESNNNACLGSQDWHNDAIGFGGGTNITIRGNRIWWCGTQCIFFDDFPASPNNILIENNMIEETAACALCGQSGEVGIKTGSNVTFRYNTIEGFYNSSAPISNYVIKGNVFLSVAWSCAPGNYTYNVFPASGGTTCGTNATRGTPRLANNSLYGPPYAHNNQANWRLSTTDVVAKAAGDPTSFPALDIDLLTRIAPPSAGAAQVAATGSSPASPTGLGLSKAVDEDTPFASSRPFVAALLGVRPRPRLRRSKRAPFSG